MNFSKHFLLSLLLGAFCLVPFSGQAQLVNMEETWQEFLKNKKASNISELVKPEKTQPANYIKYCLIYANKYFCGDNVNSADEMMSEIAAMGKDVWDRVDGFEERYEGLKKKIAAYKSLVPVWDRFLDDKNSVTRQEVEEYSAAKKVCERGTLCKYFYMISHDYFCDKDLRNARQVYDSRIKKLVATTFNPDDIEGLGDEVKKMGKFWDGMDELEPAWDAYVESGVSPGMESELPVFRCYVIPNMKACVLKAMYDICGEGEEMLAKLKDFKAMSTYPVPSDIIDAMDAIEAQVRNIKKDLTVLNTFWRKFIRSNKVEPDASYKREFACDREAEVKAYLMDGFVSPCEHGKEALANISKIRKKYKPALSSQTMDKLKELKALTKKETGDMAILTEAWEDFLPDNKFSKDYELAFSYCDKLAEIRAYAMDGILKICDGGASRLDDIENVLDENDVTIDDATQAKIDYLTSESDKRAKKRKDLNAAWDYFIENGSVSDNLEYDYDFPCDRELDVKAYVLDAYTNPCLSGKYGLGEADKIMQAHNPKISSDIARLIRELKEQLANEKGNVATLTRAWNDFVPDDQLSGGMDFVFSYCDKIAECRSYIIDGTINYCEVGKKRLSDISRLQEDYLLTFDNVMESKFEALHDRGSSEQSFVDQLHKAWRIWVDTEDPAKVREADVQLAEEYCDPTDQIKAWILYGLNDACGEGDNFLAKIEYMQQKKRLTFDDEVDYQVALLKKRIKDCQ